MVNVSPMMGIVRNTGQPQQLPVGQTLPPVPAASGFSSVLTNLMDLLKGLFDGPGMGFGSDYSKDLGLGPQIDSVERQDGSEIHLSPEAIRDFSRQTEDLREGLREEVERKLSALSYEEAPVQIDEIRRLVQQIETGGPIRNEAGDSSPVLNEIIQHVRNLQEQFVSGGMAEEEGGDAQQQTAWSYAAKSAPARMSETTTAPTTFQAPEAKADAPAPVFDAATTPAPRVKAPVPEAAPAPIPEVKPEEAPASRPAPDAAAALRPAVVPSVAQAAAASAHVESPVPEAGKPGAVPVRGLEAAGRTASEGAGRSGANPMPRTAERVDFVERIIRAAQITKTRGQTRMRIVLNPPELGGIRVNLSVKDHVLSGTIQAEQAASRELILQHLQSLRSALEEQGIHVGELQVDVEPGAQQQTPQDHPQSGTSDPSSTDPEAGPSFAGQEAAPEDPASVPRSIRHQVLDLVA